LRHCACESLRPFFAERDRSAAERAAEALPPRLPPRFDETFVVLRPPLSLLTVAHARRSAFLLLHPALLVSFLDVLGLALLFACIS
jgi:hypothetical protein